MLKVITFITFIVVTGLTTASFAAGDYIWEERYKRELVKAEQGNAKSQYAVGEMYEKGKGAIKDAKKSMEWYFKSAAQKNKKASYKLGLIYLKGKGVEKDFKVAYTWFKKSADKKYARAQYYLGEMYENGQGVLKDYDEAIKWYKLSLTGGYGIASDGIKRAAQAQKIQTASRAAAKSKSTRKSKEITKPKTVKSKKIVKPKAVAKPKTTKQKVLAGGWKKRKKPSEFLPSSISKCKAKGNRIVCTTSELKRNIGMADIKYTTKATLSDFKTDGAFRVSYRNNVSKIIITDPEFAESGTKVPVTLGWQDTEHQLTCELEDERFLVCTKSKTRKMKFRR